MFICSLVFCLPENMYTVMKYMTSICVMLCSFILFFSFLCTTWMWFWYFLVMLVCVNNGLICSNCNFRNCRHGLLCPVFKATCIIYFGGNYWLDKSLFTQIPNIAKSEYSMVYIVMSHTVLVFPTCSVKQRIFYYIAKVTLLIKELKLFCNTSLSLLGSILFTFIINHLSYLMLYQSWFTSAFMPVALRAGKHKAKEMKNDKY